MGVLNATPDSFSDGGRYLELGAATARVDEMIDEGASMIDVGGESTRPGASAVAPTEQIERVVPIIESIAGMCRERGVRVSVDTRSEPVARAAALAGASIINDVSGALGDLAAELGVGWICMHMAGTPADMADHPTYDDVVSEVLDWLVARAAAATTAGCPEVWIDPGFGFGKTLAHNLSLLAHLDRFVASGYPVAIATSRKSTLGLLTTASDARVGVRAATDQVGPADRFEASIASATWAMMSGASLVRAHDVRAHVHAATVVAGDMPGAA